MHVDAAFAVHTGATMMMGEGAITTSNCQQTFNTRSSTAAEDVAADNIIGPTLWTRKILEAQGYNIQKNVMFQDNQRAMLLETNGRKSAGKRSSHLNIRFFFVTDQKKKAISALNSVQQIN